MNNYNFTSDLWEYNFFALKCHIPRGQLNDFIPWNHHLFKNMKHFHPPLQNNFYFKMMLHCNIGER